MGSEMNCGRKRCGAAVLIFAMVLFFGWVSGAAGQVTIPNFIQEIIDGCDPEEKTFCGELETFVDAELSGACLNIVRGYLPEDYQSDEDFQEVFINSVDANVFDISQIRERNPNEFPNMTQFNPSAEQESWYVLDLYKRCLRDCYRMYFDKESKYWSQGIHYRYFVREIAKKIDESNAQANLQANEFEKLEEMFLDSDDPPDSGSNATGTPVLSVTPTAGAAQARTSDPSAIANVTSAWSVQVPQSSETFRATLMQAETERKIARQTATAEAQITTITRTAIARMAEVGTQIALAQTEAAETQIAIAQTVTAKAIAEATSEDSEDIATFLNTLKEMGRDIVYAVLVVIVIGAAFWLFLKRRKRRASRPARRRSVSSAAPGAQPQERRTLRLEDWVTADPKTMEIGSMSLFLNFSFGNIQHQGRRDYQEDSFGFSDISDPELVAKRGILAIVADGMGGLKNGKSISERAIQKFRKSFVKFSPSGDIPRQMLALVMETNHDIYETDKQKGGTTLLCVYIYRNSMYWVSVGDSAIYLFRKGRIYQLNKEHNRLNDLYLRFMYREITREQLMAEPSLQGLTANIGRRELREVDRNLTELKLQSGDRLLLCTDGVSGRLTEKELLVAMSQRDAQACADALKRMILKKNAPKQDNFTAEVIFCD